MPLCIKFDQNRMIFSLKCGGFTIFKMADIRYVEFWGAKMGFLKSPCSTSYWSSIEITALNRLVF